MKFLFKISGLVIFLLAIGCASRSKPAPIVNITQVPGAYQQTQSTAITKSTAIAADQSSSVASNTKPKLAAINDDDNEVQQAPITKKTGSGLAKTNKNNKEPLVVAKTENSAGAVNSEWAMPTHGKIVQTYTAGTKGINISGVEGQSIHAINSGKVLYSGNGLKGYGNLIIIKHDNNFLSAYAYNKTNLVKEGASIKAGQEIAKMGTNDSGKAMLHFEIRKNGKPVDPLTYIKAD